jgi:pimeloyl-ACP methyl ester carboxylesterase
MLEPHIDPSDHRELAEARRWFFEFYRSSRPPVSDEDSPLVTELAAKATPMHVQYLDETLAAVAWGDGPAVIGMHGVHGRGAQLAGFVQPLVAAGYRVVLFDAPGHSHTRDGWIHPTCCAEALRQVAARARPVHAIVAHSLGCAWALMATRLVEVNKLVCINGPASFVRIFAAYANSLRVSPGVSAKLMQLFESFDGALWHEDAPINIAKTLRQPALIINDDADDLSPLSEAQALASCWPNAELVVTHGLGHLGSLRNAGLIDRIVAFLSSDRPM